MRFLKKGWKHISEIPMLGFVPVVATILSFRNILTTLSFRGFHFGVKFQFPPSIIDLWHIVSTPSNGLSFSHPLQILTNVIVFTIVQSLLAAAYLGSINESFDVGSFSFIENAGNYFKDLFFYQVLMWILTVSLHLFTFIPFSWIFLFFLVIFAGYLLYGVPYIIVTTDKGFAASLKKSVKLGIQSVQGGDEYLSFGLKYFLLIAVLSIPFTFLTVNLKLFGIIIGTVLVIPLALTLNSATVLFFRNLLEEIRESKEEIKNLIEDSKEK